MTTSATNENKWYNEWQRMATSGTISDIKGNNERQHVTTNDSKRQQMTTSDDEW